MIFGALVSLIAAGAYAAADEIRVAHKIRSYQPTMPRDTSFDTSREDKLKGAFRRNWNDDGATLFPTKLIPFLASDEELRNLWIEAAVWQIMGKEPPNSNLRGRKRYLKFDGAWYGPQLYEYDFVARYHPEDWAKYKQYKAEQKEQEKRSQELWKKRRRRTFALPIVLIILGAILVVVGAALIKPTISEIVFKSIIIAGLVTLGVGAVIGLIRRDEWSDLY